MKPMQPEVRNYIKAAVQVCRSILESVPEPSRYDEGYNAIEEMLYIIEAETNPKRLEHQLLAMISISSFISEVGCVGLVAISMEGVMLHGYHQLTNSKRKSQGKMQSRRK